MEFKGHQGLLTWRFKPARFKKVNRKPTSFTLSTRNNDLKTSANVLENSRNNLQRFLYLVLAVVASCCYIKSLQGDFIHDDIFAVKDNLDVRTETPIFGMFFHDFWGKPMDDSTSHKSYRPLCVLSFRLQFWLHGLRPFWYRLMNVWLHALVTLMFAHVCEKVLCCTTLVSFTTALLFAVHPVHSEVVCSVVGRADSLACLLFLVAFESYVNCIRRSTIKVDENENYVSSAVSDAFDYWKSLLLCVTAGSAAMLAKETGLTVFGVCLLYDIVIEHAGTFGRRFLHRISVLTTSVVFLLYIRMYLQNYQLPRFSADENPASHSDSGLTRVLTYSYLCFYNAGLLLAPATLCYDWQMGSIPLVETLFDLRNLATFIFFVHLGVLFVLSISSSLAKEERKILFVGLMFLTIPFLPASNLFFPVGFVVAERVLYIPSLGYCLIINFGLAKMAGLPVSEKFKSSGKYNASTRSKVVSCCYVGMLVLFVLKTWHQTSAWQNRGTLFRSGVHAVPHNAKIRYNYANYLKDIGKKEEAIQHYRVAIQLSPRHASFHNNLGTLLGNTEEAMKHFKLAIKYEPEHANALLNLGTLLSVYNKLTQGEKHLRKSLRFSSQPVKVLRVLADVLGKKDRVHELDKLYRQTLLRFPHDVSLYSDYGLALVKQGRMTDAENAWLKALKIDPTLSNTLFNYGILLKRQGRLKESFTVLRRCLEIDPISSQLYQDVVPLFHHMGYLTEAVNAVNTILTSFNASVLQYQKGNILKDMELYQEAIKSYQMAIELNVTNVDAYLNLGATHHFLKNFEKARLYYERVLKLDSSHKVAKENLDKLARLV